jgi:hypothetical protein
MVHRMFSVHAGCFPASGPQLHSCSIFQGALQFHASISTPGLALPGPCAARARATTPQRNLSIRPPPRPALRASSSFYLVDAQESVLSVQTWGREVSGLLDKLLSCLIGQRATTRSRVRREGMVVYGIFLHSYLHDASHSAGGSPPAVSDRYLQISSHPCGC